MGLKDEKLKVAKDNGANITINSKKRRSHKSSCGNNRQQSIVGKEAKGTSRQ